MNYKFIDELTSIHMFLRRNDFLHKIMMIYNNQQKYIQQQNINYVKLKADY